MEDEGLAEHYAYLLHLTPEYQEKPESDWSAAERETVATHFEHLMSFARKGNVVYLGRSIEDPRIRFGVVVFQGLTAEEVQEIGREDPVVQRGIMTVEVHRFRTIVPNESVGSVSRRR